MLLLLVRLIKLLYPSTASGSGWTLTLEPAMIRLVLITVLLMLAMLIKLFCPAVVGYEKLTLS
jgi:hypothetical protein